MFDRAQYKPGDRLNALKKAKKFRSREIYNEKRKPFATEQKPGSGGFQAGSIVQAQRNFDEGAQERRSQELRPEDGISKDIYRDLFN